MSMDAQYDNPNEQRPRRGPWIIAGMFLFASLVSLGLWTYWELHTRPFREMTDRLGREFPASSPRVEGGKHGLHRDTDEVLRIVMRIDYDPAAAPERYADQIDRIMQIAAAELSLEPYDRCDIHLFRQEVEADPVVTSKSIPADDFPDAPSEPASR